MLFLADVSSFRPQNWYVITPSVILMAITAVGVYLWLKDKPRPAHASVKFYIWVAVILTLITVVEIAILPISESGAIHLAQHWWLVILYFLAIVKFVMVLMFFMHLYFDKWLYTMFFGIGMFAILGTVWALLALVPGKPIKEPVPWEKKAPHAPAAAPEHGGLVPADRLVGLSAPERGLVVFEALQCGHCHKVEGVTEARGTFGPALDGLVSRAATRVEGMGAETYIRLSIENPGLHVPRGYFNGMPKLRDRMSDAEYEDLIQYLLTLGAALPVAVA